MTLVSEQTELLPLIPAQGESRELTVLDERLRGTTFVEHSVKSLINSPESTGMGFWSINPYVGCEFGCSYCYARYAHRYVVERRSAQCAVSSARRNDWPEFEQLIFVKQRRAVLQALERDLKKIFSRREAPDSHSIVIGTATDPYQPAERKFEITRAILQRLAYEKGLSIEIITKSALIRRDIEVLKALNEQHHLTVHISLITTDMRLIKIFEARTPTPRVRLKALKELTSAGIEAGLIVAPILPGITDNVRQISLLFAAAKRAGAHFVHPSPLRLYQGVRPFFLPVLERHFPELLEKYLNAYSKSISAPKRYTKLVHNRFARIGRRYGIGGQADERADRRTGGRAESEPQLALWN